MQITRICKSLIIISLKNMIIFLKKHVHVFWKSRTCFPKNMYVFSWKHVRLFLERRTCFFKTLTAHHETQNFPLKTFRKANNNVYYTLYLRSKRLLSILGYEKKFDRFSFRYPWAGDCRVRNDGYPTRHRERFTHQHCYSRASDLSLCTRGLRRRSHVDYRP